MEVFKIAIKIKKRYQGRQFEKNYDIINERIKHRELLVITDKGEKLGLISREKALEEASKRNLDLILVSKNSKVPVAKILDYGKYKYERKKKESEKKKNSKIIEQKELRITSNIGEHDLEVKIKNARKFINQNKKIKISLMFKGREIMNKEKGFETMKKFISKLEDVSVVEKQPVLNGRFYDAYLAPKNKK